MSFNADKARDFMRSLTPEEIAEGNRREHEEYDRQITAFRSAYAEGRCYLCDAPFDQMRAAHPCTHWLLRRCNFKKKDFLQVAGRYDYHDIAAFLRWCANEEKLLRNINDLEAEKSDRKVLSYTIKWKNIDWTFDCTQNDIAGHGSGPSSHPHYHFQMRIDGRQFINFNEFHVPFSDRDLFTLSLRKEPRVIHGFGAAGSGMQEAVSVDPDLLLEHVETTEDEGDAAYHLSTIVDASDQPLSGDEIQSIMNEAKRFGKSFALIAQQRLKGRANVQTIVSPVESIADIASRTENKPR